MISQDEKIELFLNAITENLELRRKQINDEIDAVRKEEEEKALREATERSEAYIETESSKIILQANRARSVLETELRNELAATRIAITGQVFQAVAEKLHQFTKTAGYEEFIRKSAGRFSSYYGDKPITVFVKTEDMKYKDIILSALSPGCRVLADDSILIGGCKAKSDSSGVNLDDTLDSRLDAQRQSFYESSGLSVQAG